MVILTKWSNYFYGRDTNPVKQVSVELGRLALENWAVSPWNWHIEPGKHRYG